MVLLIFISVISGLVLGRFYRLHVLIPATAVLLALASYLGMQQGLATGALAFVLSAVVLQISYFVGLFLHLVIAFKTTAPQATPSASEIGYQSPLDIV